MHDCTGTDLIHGAVAGSFSRSAKRPHTTSPNRTLHLTVDGNIKNLVDPGDLVLRG